MKKAILAIIVLAALFLMWEDIPYRNGIRIIPETITAGTYFTEGEYGWWGDTLYKSKLATNTYTPDQYPDGWEKVDV